MKKVVIITIVLIYFAPLFAQTGQQMRREKIREIEMIKLIEKMNLSEETSVRFFAKRNEHNKNQWNRIREKDSLVNELTLKIETASQKDIKAMVDKILAKEQEITQERVSFIKSLKDILNDKQVGEMILFENDFKRSVKDFIKGRNRERSGKSE